MKKLERLKEHMVFLTSVLVAVSIIIYGYICSNTLNFVSGKVMRFVSDQFGWLYIAFVFFLCCFMVWLAFGKYGKLRLGEEGERPEYTNFTWYAMLFCGGTGIGLVFWSIAEPLSHYVAPPGEIVGGTIEAANFSIRTCFLHWGVTQWVCFALVGLGIAYFRFRKNQSSQISNLLLPVIGEKASKGFWGKVIDIFAVTVSFAGVATSLGLGVMQICGGLNYLFQIPNNKSSWFIIILAITCVFTASSISGVNRGIRILSNINTFLALLLLSLGFFIGPHMKILNTLVNGLGQHLQNFVGDTLMIDPFDDNTWIMNWRVFYFAWFIAWTPFVGTFIARISRGRTIREFIIGVVVIPSVFTFIWLSVFGTIALYVSGNWSLNELTNIIASPETAVFIILNEYPLNGIISILIIVLLAIFFITSADSATYSLGMMTSDGNLNPPVYKKIVWAIIESTIAYVLLSADSLKPLQTISIAASLPFLFIMIAMCFSLVKELNKESDV